MKVFGCVAYAHVSDQQRKKLDIKGEKCIFVGYSDEWNDISISSGNAALLVADVIFCSDISLLKTAKRVGDTINVKIESNVPLKSKFIPVAMYNNNGEMLEFVIVPTNSISKSATIFFKDTQEAEYIKVFLWDSHKNLRPLTTAEKVYIER